MFVIQQGKIKGVVVPVFNTAPHHQDVSLTLALEVSGQLHVPATSSPPKMWTLVHTAQGLNEPQNDSGGCGGDINSSC
jgi:hypothetical protein